MITQSSLELRSGKCFLLSVSVLLLVSIIVDAHEAEESITRRPNLIIFLVDDVGYGDIGCFGGRRAKTPNLDRMATQGMKLTDFYVHPVCGVTRASLMTGCYAMRVAEVDNRKNGHPILHPKEITIAEVLKKAGYKTGMIGKWHLGGGRRAKYPPELMPNAQGFDYFFGAPSHNGTTRTVKASKFRMQLMRQNTVIDDSIDQKEMNQITRQYTEEAEKFIKEHKEKPFFLYVAHNMAHVVLGASEKFQGKSGGGLYGDVIEELDWSAGQILQTLKEQGIDDNTLMIFTSDNGPWIEGHLKGKGGNDAHYGSAKPLRGSKMMTWEGGVRVPTIVRWPGQVPKKRSCSEPLTIMDLMPTFAKLASAKLPTDRVIDGKDIMPILRGEKDSKSPHEAIYYYSYVHLQAVRSGKWKLVLPRPAKPKWTLWSARMTEAVTTVQLFDLEADVSETKNVAKKHPEVVAKLMKLIEKGRREIGDYNVIGSKARFFDEGPKRPKSLKWTSQPRVTSKYDNFKPLGNLRFDFESGNLQGWKIVQGKFGKVISDRNSLPNWKNRPFNHQGKYHLSTVALKDGASDTMKGMIESPCFKVMGAKMAFLVSGGNRDNVYVALCDLEGKELLRTGGNDGPQMVRRVWDVEKYRNQTVYLRIVDQAESNWGHLTFDDFSVEGQLDPTTTRRRFDPMKD